MSSSWKMTQFNSTSNSWLGWHGSVNFVSNCIFRQHLWCQVKIRKEWRVLPFEQQFTVWTYFLHCVCLEIAILRKGSFCPSKMPSYMCTLQESVEQCSFQKYIHFINKRGCNIKFHVLIKSNWLINTSCYALDSLTFDNK